MKITEIVPDKTDNNKTTVRTEPPITEAVFSKFQKTPFNNVSFMRRDTFLEINGPPPPEKAVAGIEDALTNAEAEIVQEDQSKKEAHQQFLDALSKKTGLPIGKPSVP